VIALFTVRRGLQYLFDEPSCVGPVLGAQAMRRECGYSRCLRWADALLGSGTAPDVLTADVSFKDWVSEGHLAYLMSYFAKQLDLSAIEQVCEQEGRGYPPYRPRIMAKVLPHAERCARSLASA